MSQLTAVAPSPLVKSLSQAELQMIMQQFGSGATVGGGFEGNPTNNPHFSGVTNQPPSRARTSSAATRIEENERDKDKGWEVEWMREMERRGLDERVSSKFPGLSLQKDLPMGMEDTVERMMRAASIRSFVPTTMTVTFDNAFSAFEHFLELPPSLAKVRYEQEAWARCQR